MIIYEKPNVISAETVMRVRKVTGMPVLDVKRFLEQASPVLYERFLNAVDTQSLKTYSFLTDPIENEPDVKDIMQRVEEETEAELRDLKRRIGFCHLFWHKKKLILKERYNIEWFSPTDLNPGICFD